MASKIFKSEMTRRFVEVVKYLIMSEAVSSKTEIGLLMNQPLQVVSKLLTGATNHHIGTNTKADFKHQYQRPLVHYGRGLDVGRPKLFSKGVKNGILHQWKSIFQSHRGNASSGLGFGGKD